MKKTLLALCTMAIFTGCVSVPKADQTKAEKVKSLTAPSVGTSGIYIFAAQAPRDLWLDGNCLGIAGKKGFFYQEVAPGKHIVSTESEISPNHLTLNTQVNKFYYVQQTTRPSLLTVANGLKILSEDKARQELKDLTLTENSPCRRSEIKLPR